MKKLSNHPASPLPPRENNALAAVIQLADACNAHNPHTKKVTRLALVIFDSLQGHHHLGNRERFWLHCAAILHDIGSIEGKKEHHKASLRIILNNTLMPFNNKERLIIASIARYHRKALPDPSHDHFAALEPNERGIVSVLAAILRLADGISQCFHDPQVGASIKVSRKKVTISCHVSKLPESDITAWEKSDLMELVFKRQVIILWKEG